MRDGVFSFYIRVDQATTIRAIALVESDVIRGFNQSHLFSVKQWNYPIERSLKHRSTHWRVDVMDYADPQGVTMRGFPAKVKGDEGEEQFWFEGQSLSDRNVRVEIQGAWLQNLPWHRTSATRIPLNAQPTSVAKSYRLKRSGFAPR